MFFNSKSSQSSASPVKRFFWPSVCMVFTLLKLWLVNAQSIVACSNFKFDDELFLTQAESLVNGEWLGKSSWLTMFKGPVYPIWLALNHLSGVPLLISQALLYALACGVLVWALRPVVTAPWARAVIYLAVLYNPASWDAQASTRLLRENIYPSLTLILLASTMGVVLRICIGPKSSVPWAVVAGFSGALFAMTREEGVWVLPSLVIILGWGIASSRRTDVRTWMVTTICASLAYILLITAVCYENWKHYGIFETCETTTDYFKSAYGSLTRVKTSKWNPFVPVSREARQKLYDASPAYRTIGPKLEERILRWNPARNTHNAGDDIIGGFFIWVFRQAVNLTVGYDSGMTEARNWYRKLTVEIEDACRDGRLDCLPSRSSLAPPWRNEYVPDLRKSFLQACLSLITFKNVSPQTIPPDGGVQVVRRFEDMTNENIPFYKYQMTGLVGSRIGDAFYVVAADKLVVDGNIWGEPVAVDSGIDGKEYRYWRLTVDTTFSNRSDLVVVAKDDQNQEMRIPINAKSEELTTGYFSWKLISFHVEPDVGSIPIPLANFRIRTLAALTTVYSLLMPLLAVIAFVLLLIRIIRDLRNRYVHSLTLFTLALLCAVVVRLLLLSFIDVSSFDAVTTQYMSPAYVLYIAAVAMVLISQGEMLLVKRHNN